MELAEQLDPEEFGVIMQRFFRILSDGVERFEGFVDKFTGDGIMALFGAPIAHEDHAQRACYAALHLRDELARYATQVKREHGVGFSTRMGINSGTVVVGRIGDDLRMDYTAQGHTVGLAQRMESLASPDTCYLSATAAGLAAGYFQLEDLGEFRVKGVSTPMRVHRLIGPGAATTRLDVSRARGLTRFVGRDDDMATLEAALAQAQAGNGQVVGVVAAAGTGKSRLCYEFAQRCHARGLIVNEGHALAHGKNIPYLPILEVFRAYFGISDGDDDAMVRDKIAGRLLLLDESFRDVLPVIFEFLRVPDPEHPVPRMDPEAKQRQLFAVVRRVIRDRRVGADRVFALIEDLHWADPGSEALLAQWVDAIGGTSSFLIVNFRPEYHAEWMQKSYYRQLPLAALGSEAIRDLLADLLGADPSMRGLADDIHARTGGNPFFIEEVVQSLIESRNLQGECGAYRLVTPIERVEVPASVQSLLGARIDRLPKCEKEVLQTAAVIGKEFSEPILRRVLTATSRALSADGDLSAALAALRTREFLYETALYPVAEYTFKHPLTHEVALGSQLQERRRQVHAAVADAIEATHADKLDEQAALLAHHCEQAGQPLTAAAWHARAGRSVGKNDFHEAGRHWRRARELLRDLGDEPDASKLGAEACFHLLALGGLRVRLSGEEARQIFQEGLVWAERAGDRLLTGRLHQALSVFEIGNDHVDAALTHAAEWERVARALPEDERRAMALWPSLAPLFFRGDLAAARANALQQIDWTRDHPEWGLRDWGLSAHVGALWNLAQIELYDGSLGRARQILDGGIRLARSLGDFEFEVILGGTLLRLADMAAEPDLARAAVQRGIELSERLGTTSRISAYSALGMQYFLDGDLQRAGEAWEYARSLTAPGARFLDPALRYFLANTALAGGNPERARGIAEETLTSCLEMGARLGAIEAAVALSAALRAIAGAGEAERIEEVLATADRLIAETGACNLTAFVLVERAGLAELRGETRQQESHLRRALEAFTQMGATGRAARLARELRS
jgi:class 3 adenylate cyclase